MWFDRWIDGREDITVSATLRKEHLKAGARRFPGLHEYELVLMGYNHVQLGVRQIPLMLQMKNMVSTKAKTIDFGTRNHKGASR